MPIKKSDLYSSIWASCDELRGGMDASQYKDYVLFMLFIKYITDKYGNSTDFAQPVTIPKGSSFTDMLSLRGKSDIGDRINTQVIAPLVRANDRLARSDFPDFNDPNKLGQGKEMVDRLTNLINIFADPRLDFSQNRAEHDDILGDAYEYGAYFWDSYEWWEAYDLPPAAIPPALPEYNGTTMRKTDMWDCWRRQFPTPPTVSPQTVQPYTVFGQPYWGDAVVFTAWSWDTIMPIWYNIFSGNNDVTHRDNRDYPLADTGIIINRWYPNTPYGGIPTPRFDADVNHKAYPAQFLVRGDDPGPPEYWVYSGVMFDMPGMVPFYTTGDGSERLWDGNPLPEDAGVVFETGDRVDYRISFRTYVRVDIDAVVHPPSNSALNPNDTYKSDRFGFRILWGDIMTQELGAASPGTRVRYPWAAWGPNASNVGTNPPFEDTNLWSQTNNNGTFDWAIQSNRNKQ